MNVSRTAVFRFVPFVLAACALIFALPAPGQAQYFGRNKVQYEDFEWSVLQTERFDVYHYDRMSSAAVEAAGRSMERWYTRLSTEFDHTFEEKRPLVLYADKPDFQQTNTTPSLISEGTGGFTEGLKNRIVLPMAETQGLTDHVLGHELVHSFQFDIARREATGGQNRFFQLPLWAVEGLAEYLSTGPSDPHTAMWLRDAVVHDDLPSLDQLSRDPRYFPYRFGEAFWAYIAGIYGDRRVTTLYRAMARRGVGPGIREVLETTPDSLGEAWKRQVLEDYGPIVDGRTRPEDVGERIVTGATEDEEDWMLAPSLSPDGERIAFLSQRDLFTIDLFVADVTTGDVLGKLGSSLRNPHFDALAFINTSGSWSPDGRRFAFVTTDEGDNRIAVADVGTREIVETYAVRDVGAIYSVAWSPDGRRIALSGASGGVTDLFLLDVESGAARRLTDDRYAELHPAWSPDGATIVFSTDRDGERALETLDLPQTGLGFLEVASGSVRVERPFGAVKHANPQYAPDGSVFFISTPDGVPDVYRLDPATGDLFRVTRVATGVSGITALSPALTVAKETGDLAFSVFSEGDYLGRRIAAPRAAGEPAAPAAGQLAAVLPPVERIGTTRVERYRSDATSGLPSGRDFASAEYDPDLSLDYLAPPTAGVGLDRTGAAVGGSVGFFFSDMLGDQQVVLGVQANGGVQDIGGEVLYADLENRWNWGVRVGRIPYRTAFTRIGARQPNGGRPIDLLIQRTFYNSGSLTAEYPFSTTRRFEVDGGYTRIGFDLERIPTLVFPDGTVLEGDREDLESPDALDIGHASVALVEDFSFFGFTSPIRGGRARLGIEQNAGSITFTNLLADWRRYYLAEPVTFAVRGLHLGRYGPDAEDFDVLTPLFVGFPSLVRGYDPESFEADECTQVEGDPTACPEFDRLVGSRIATASAELRIPLVGTEEFGLISGGFLPVELALFTDAGVAWTSDDGPAFELARDSIERIPVFSSGASLRINLLGAIIGEIYYARPWQRPDAGGQWGFQLLPGW